MFKLFISDMHLDENRPDITDIFLRFLSHTAPASQALYILGDFFESWIGDDNLTSFNQMIITALRTATTGGLPIFIMHGNRDFLLSKQFLAQTGCQLLADEYVLDVYGTPVLLMHGDTLCTADKKYLKFRKKTRNRLMQKLFLWKNLAKRQQIAENYREKSKFHTSTTAQHIMDVTQQEVEHQMCRHQVQTLIHGHTHRQAIHSFILNQKPAERIVLAPWHETGSALSWDDSGEKKFLSIT